MRLVVALLSLLLAALPAYARHARGAAAPGGGGATQIFSYANFSGQPSTINLVGGSTAWDGAAIAVTSGASGAHEAGAAWYKTPVNIASFTSDFTFQITGGVTLSTSAATTSGAVLNFTSTAGVQVGQEVMGTNIPGQTLVQSVTSTTVTLSSSVSGTVASGASIIFQGGFGESFIVQNDPRTTIAAADSNGLGYFAYSTNATDTAIENSVAIVFNATPNATTGSQYFGTNPSVIGLYIDGGMWIDNGIAPVQDLAPQAINLHSGDLMSAHVVYDGTVLSLALTDTTTGAIAYFAWPVNIPSIVGGSTAYVGFGAGTIPPVVQSVNSWTWDQGYNTRLSAPTFSPAAGAYTTSQSVALSGPAGSTIYYTTNGKPPTTASSIYSVPITVSANELVQAIAVESGYTNSLVAQGNYQVQTSGSPFLNFPSGFASANGLVQTSGVASISGSALQITPGITTTEIGSAYYAVPVNIQTFTDSFTLQFSGGNNLNYNTVMAVIQNQAQSAMPSVVPLLSGGFGTGPQTSSGMVSGGLYSLGFGNYVQTQPDAGYTGIPNSVGVKFDFWNGETVGLFTGGAIPYTPQTSITGVNLKSGNKIACTLTYDGTTLSLNMEDTVTLATFATSWPVNIPSAVGANTAYIGFSASSYYGSVNDVTAWTYHN